MVNDPETTVQAYCLEMVESTIVKRLIRWHQVEQAKMSSDEEDEEDEGGSSRRRSNNRRAKASSKDAASEDVEDTTSVWQLLDAVQGPLVRCLQKSLNLASRSGNLDTRSLVAALQHAAILGTEKGASDAEAGEDKLADRYRYGAWVLLEGLSTINTSTSGANSKAEGGTGGSKSKKSKIDIDFEVVVKCWQNLAEQGDLKKFAKSEAKTDDNASTDSQRILRVLGTISSKIPKEVATDLADSLMSMLHTFALPPALTHGVIETLTRLCNEKAPNELEGRKIVGGWCQNLLQSCEKGMVDYMSMKVAAEDGSEKGSPASSKGSEKRSPCGSPFEMVEAEAEAKIGSPYEMVDGEGVTPTKEGEDEKITPSKVAQQRLEHRQHAMVTRYLFTLGEISMVGFDQTADEKRRDPSKSFADEAKRGAKANGGGECGTIVAVPKRIVTLVQALLAPKLHLNTTSGNGKTSSRLIPSTVRAHAFMTLGKLCLVSSRLAKDSVNIFVRELQCAAEPSVRSNILLIMNDLCTRYTFLVDRHIPSMAKCLVDENAVVRRHALILLSQLLLQEYIKWRGDLFFYFVMMMVDKEPNLRQMAYFTLSKPLLNRYPTLFQDNFIKAFFILNDYHDHPSFEVTENTDGNDFFKGMAGPGKKEQQRRHQIYQLMLAQMSEEQKLSLSGKLVQDVLGAALDGIIPINEESTRLLMKDALLVLCSKPMQLKAKVGKPGDDDADEAEAQANADAGMEAVKTKLLSKVRCKQ
jgi:hypothetical protein